MKCPEIQKKIFEEKSWTGKFFTPSINISKKKKGLYKYFIINLIFYNAVDVASPQRSTSVNQLHYNPQIDFIFP